MPLRARLMVLTFAAAALIAIAPASARADQITLTNGQVFNGEITAENAKTITIRISDPSAAIAISRRINKSNVKSIARPQRQGPPYVQIPIHGEIGRDVTADALAAGLAAADRANPKYVLLDIDSPGGSIAEMVRILDTLAAASRNRPIVAYVHNAYSAAAILAMSCRQIYVTPHGVIGAAVPFKPTKNGPADVDAKFRSAIEAKERTYIVAAGHDPLLLRGMMEMDVELYLTTDPATGHPALSTEGPGTCLKAKDTILTLTADEAAACGLAHVASDLPDVGRQLAGGPWYEATRLPWAATLSAAASDARAARQDRALPGGSSRDRAALASTKTELDANLRRIAELTAKLRNNDDAFGTLRRDVEAGQVRILATYHDTLSRAKTQADVARAKDARDAQNDDLIKTAQATADKLKAEGDKLSTELKQLRARQQELLASLPTD